MIYVFLNNILYSCNMSEVYMKWVKQDFEYIFMEFIHYKWIRLEGVILI